METGSTTSRYFLAPMDKGIPTYVAGAGEMGHSKKEFEAGRPGSFLIGESHLRGCWPKGIIVEIFEGCDGYTRQVNVRTATGVVNRDIRQVCLLGGG